MYQEAIRPAWVEVNLSNLDYNIKNIMKKVWRYWDLPVMIC